MTFSNGLFLRDYTSSRTVAGCIDIYEKVVSDPSALITTIEEQASYQDSDFKWVKASVLGAGQLQDVRTNYDMCISEIASIYNNDTAKIIHNELFVLFASVINSYQLKYHINENLYIEPLNILKYSDNQGYLNHYDGGTETARSVSAIAYLNNDYSGGEIEFVNFKIKIKPEPGMMIIFPSNYAYSHIAHPVTSGKKYSVVTWARDRT